MMSEEEKKQYLKDLYYNKLNFCGCGTPGRVLKLLRIYLKCSKYFHDGKNTSSWIGRTERRIGKDVFMFLAYIADSIKLTEHGGNVTGAWPTENGNKCLEALSYIKGDLDGLEY